MIFFSQRRPPRPREGVDGVSARAPTGLPDCCPDDPVLIAHQLGRSQVALTPSIVGALADAAIGKIAAEEAARRGEENAAHAEFRHRQLRLEHASLVSPRR